ncbi:ankyrin repeat domain-containing protein [Stenotrophomonas sp. S39]|uniref:ankyrin repeat domain-containing protein n=1 Tax=Stenotrophomonas sp. S39 TaxID=2767451 RepID=UPI00190A7F23|nr:ankyrin repeat domain-containing protein [Stenotrophomonas sp. S39]MBK0052963.1 ankyrin repeat domain-containing protein [Stenotrophomonas sp. S39]
MDKLEKMVEANSDVNEILTNLPLVAVNEVTLSDTISRQFVLSHARSVNLVEAAIVAGADPNFRVPAFYTVLSDAAAAFLAPLTTMLDHEERTRRYHKYVPHSLFEDLFKKDSIDTDKDWLKMCGNSLAVHQVVSTEYLGVSTATQNPSLLFHANSADHARGLIECGCGARSLHNSVHADVVHYLVSLGVDPNAQDEQGLTPLHTVVSGEAAQALVECGADPNAATAYKKSWTPLHTATNADVAQVLIDAGANISARTRERCTPLHTVDNNVALLLLSKGANPNARDRNGKTPLFNFNDRMLNASRVRTFVQAGADVNAKDNKGAGILDEAYAFCYVSAHTVKVLLDSGYNPMDKIASSRTLLHWLIDQSVGCRLIHRIIDLGVDVNAQDENCETALHYLANTDYTKRMNWLLQRKADPRIRNNEGLRPSDIAVCTKAKQLLLEHEARWDKAAIAKAVGSVRKQPVARRRM